MLKMDMSAMMPMWFANTSYLMILFKGLESEEGEYFKYISILALIIAMGIAHELIAYYRYKDQLKLEIEHTMKL